MVRKRGGGKQGDKATQGDTEKPPQKGNLAPTCSVGSSADVASSFTYQGVVH